MTIFKNRNEAGRLLALKLKKFRNDNPIIFALTRGGLPVGYEIAKALHAPLDIIIVRKIGVPNYPELAAGALIDGKHPELIINEQTVRLYNIPNKYLESRTKQEIQEIERRREIYLKGRQPLNVQGRTAIIADDGIATGSTMRAAIQALQRRKPKHIIIAVAVAPVDTVERLEREVDEIICLEVPCPFYSIGYFYKNFSEITDKDVVNILEERERTQKKNNKNKELETYGT